MPDLEVLVWSTVGLSIVLVMLAARALFVLSEVRDDCANSRKRLARLEAQLVFRPQDGVSNTANPAPPD